MVGFGLVRLANSTVSAGRPGGSAAATTDVRSIGCLDPCDNPCGTKGSSHSEFGQVLGIRLGAGPYPDILALYRAG